MQFFRLASLVAETVSASKVSQLLELVNSVNAHTITLSNATFTVSNSFNMDSCGEDTAKEIRQSKLDDEVKQESIEIEKWLKKEVAGDFLLADEEMLFVYKQGQLKPESAYTANFM